MIDHQESEFAKVNIGGIPTVCASHADLCRKMVSDCMRARNETDRLPKLVFDSNGHAISMAASDPIFNAALMKADYVHADGGIVVAASRVLTDQRIPERTATTDFIHAAAEASVRADLRLYLLGATSEVNDRCVQVLEDTYPRLKIVGNHHGYFKRCQEESLCRSISEKKPDVVWVGLGKPNEQLFCVRNRDRIRAGWLVTCGGCYDFVTNKYPRAPLWMRNSGLEWLHRMTTNPRRLFWRYLTSNPHALCLILTRTKHRRVQKMSS